MQLKNFCQKHELDTQLIDSKISYTENRQYLETLVIKTFKSFSDLDHHGDRMLVRNSENTSEFPDLKPLHF